MSMKEWLEQQKIEALGDTNRYYFHERYDRNAADDDELVMYYIEFGAKTFSELHKEEVYVLI